MLPRRVRSQHRVWKLQPAGGRSRLGISPDRTIRRRRPARGVGGGGKERDRVRVRRVGIHLLHPAHFDDPAEVHDRDPVCDVPDDGQIVRDEQIGDAELTPQTGQEVDHLCLDRDVERAHWLIANDQIRVDSDRPGDPDPLALHTAELARVSAREAGSRPTSDRSSRTLVDRSRGEASPWMAKGSARMSPTV